MQPREVSLAKQREYKRLFYKSNRLLIDKRTAAYIASHPEVRRRICRNYYLRHREQALAASRKHRLKNLARYNTYHKIRRFREKGAVGQYTLEQWVHLVNAFDNRCAMCGLQSDKLTADHKIPISKGGANYIDNIQPLCSPCNSSKGARTWFASRPVDKSWPIDKNLMFLTLDTTDRTDKLKVTIN